MADLQKALGPEKYAERRQQWVDKIKEQQLAQASPTDRVRILNSDFKVSDEDLGRMLIDGTAEESFGGMGKRFSRYSAESDSKIGKIGYELTAAGTYGADFTFQSLGFAGIGSAAGALGKVAKAESAAPGESIVVASDASCSVESG